MRSATRGCRAARNARTGIGRGLRMMRGRLPRDARPRAGPWPGPRARPSARRWHHTRRRGCTSPRSGSAPPPARGSPRLTVQPFRSAAQALSGGGQFVLRVGEAPARHDDPAHGPVKPVCGAQRPPLGAVHGLERRIHGREDQTHRRVERALGAPVRTDPSRPRALLAAVPAACTGGALSGRPHGAGPGPPAEHAATAAPALSTRRKCFISCRFQSVRSYG